jgi:glycosyltransferase involved in cell wall biosynthesis
MKRFSVIIPTIWKGPWITELIQKYCDTEYVDEIILINNDNTEMIAKNIKIPENEKIKLITPPTNLFVNPSWNLGVSLSKNENIIISNDDILFDTEKYFIFLSCLGDLKKYGIIGMNSDNYSLDKDTEITLNYHGDVKNTGGWACLLCIHKNAWVPIPETMKIYCGDNFLLAAIRPVLELRGIKIKTVMSSSANTSIDWVKKITDNDIFEWHKLIGIA